MAPELLFLWIWYDWLTIVFGITEVFLFISCRPHSTDSATHRKMTLSLADRCSKTQKIRILPMAGRDPECQRTEMIKVCCLSFTLGFCSVKDSISRVPIVAQQKRTQLVHIKMRVWSLASLSGLRICCCCELWYRSQTWLRSPLLSVSVAVAAAVV